MSIRKVLLVDDDPNIRKLAKMSLERVGKWEVAVASSGVEALNLVHEHRPDVVILDVMMPELDGRSTLVRLKEDKMTSDLPVILMTAKVQGQEIADYMALGAVGVIVKPFDPLSLPKEITALLEGKSSQRVNNDQGAAND